MGFKLLARGDWAESRIGKTRNDRDSTLNWQRWLRAQRLRRRRRRLSARLRIGPSNICAIFWNQSVSFENSLKINLAGQASFPRELKSSFQTGKPIAPALSHSSQSILCQKKALFSPLRFIGDAKKEGKCGVSCISLKFCWRNEKKGERHGVWEKYNYSCYGKRWRDIFSAEIFRSCRKVWENKYRSYL